jgi:hypothetical protein
MPPKSKMIARSPSPPEEDDGEEEWPVYGVVGEDVDVFGISSYEIRWKNWSRPDGTNTTWMRDIEGDSTLVESWNDSLKDQRLRKAAASQSIDITRLASTPMHDRLTFERSEAVQEKMEERLRIAEPGQLYQGWMTEIEDQIARQESGRLGGEGSGPARSKKVNRIPPVGREESYAESSRSVARREQRAYTMQHSRRESPPFLGGDDDDLGSITIPGRHRK